MPRRQQAVVAAATAAAHRSAPLDRGRAGCRTMLTHVRCYRAATARLKISGHNRIGVNGRSSAPDEACAGDVEDHDTLLAGNLEVL
jgi:hypothetical protein